MPFKHIKMSEAIKVQLLDKHRQDRRMNKGSGVKIKVTEPCVNKWQR